MICMASSSSLETARFFLLFCFELVAVVVPSSLTGVVSSSALSGTGVSVVEVVDFPELMAVVDPVGWNDLVVPIGNCSSANAGFSVPPSPVSAVKQ